MGRHTLIVEDDSGALSTVEVFAKDSAELFEIGHELLPGRRLAAVCHQDDDDGEED
jgi:hypothetical protein